MGLIRAEIIPNIQNHEYYHLSILKPVSSAAIFLSLSKASSTDRSETKNRKSTRTVEVQQQEWIKIVKDGDIYFSWYSDDRKTPVSKVVNRAD